MKNKTIVWILLLVFCIAIVIINVFTMPIREGIDCTKYNKNMCNLHDDTCMWNDTSGCFPLGKLPSIFKNLIPTVTTR